jgi:hypothetical protein
MNTIVVISEEERKEAGVKIAQHLPSTSDSVYSTLLHIEIAGIDWRKYDLPNNAGELLKLAFAAAAISTANAMKVQQLPKLEETKKPFKPKWPTNNKSARQPTNGE